MKHINKLRSSSKVQRNMFTYFLGFPTSHQKATNGHRLSPSVQAFVWASPQPAHSAGWTCWPWWTSSSGWCSWSSSKRKHPHWLKCPKSNCACYSIEACVRTSPCTPVNGIYLCRFLIIFIRIRFTEGSVLLLSSPLLTPHIVVFFNRASR